MAISLEDIKKLSPKIKVLIVCLAYLILGFFYYMFSLQATLMKRSSLDTKLTELQQQVAEKEKVVAQIDRYIREINSLKEAFKVALLKLPNQREIPALLASVAISGRAAGVEFLLFEPKPPEKKTPETKPAAPPKPAGAKAPAQPPKPADAKAPTQSPKPAVPEKFYDEILVRVQMKGGFHNTLSFFEQVGRFPRIVNVEQIEIGGSSDEKGRGRIVKTSCIVKTYMFVDKKP
jgi:type IV pilus assembly protein PilO